MNLSVWRDRPLRLDSLQQHDCPDAEKAQDRQQAEVVDESP